MIGRRLMESHHVPNWQPSMPALLTQSSTQKSTTEAQVVHQLQGTQNTIEEVAGIRIITGHKGGGATITSRQVNDNRGPQGTAQNTTCHHQHDHQVEGGMGVATTVVGVVTSMEVQGTSIKDAHVHVMSYCIICT